MWRALAFGATPSKRAALVRHAMSQDCSPSCWQHALFLSALLARAEEQFVAHRDAFLPTKLHQPVLLDY